MSRISFQRNTPEGWQTIIQRMAALNGLNIDPATARQVVKYLSTNLGSRLKKRSLRRGKPNAA
jgi:hypothetical protein